MDRMASLYKSLFKASAKDHLEKINESIKPEDGGTIVCPFPASSPYIQQNQDIDIGRAIVTLREGDAKARAATARLIGDLAFLKRQQIPEAIWPLAVLLKIDEDSVVRGEAAWALWKLDDKRAGEALLHALANDHDLNVQERASRALGLLGVQEAVPLMIALFSLGRSVPAKLRAAIVASLGLLVDNRAVKILANAALDSEPVVRYEAVKSLGRYLCTFPSETVEQSFSQIINSISPYREKVPQIRQAAIRALRFCHDKRAAEAVADAAVHDPDAPTRRQAIEALLCYEGPAVEAALLEAIEDSNWDARKAAGRVLSESVRRSRIYNAPRVSEALSRMERMFPSGSREWRLAADAFASL